MRRWLGGLALGLAGLACAELVARLAFDFPIYGADSEVGYWLLPSQSGTFSRTRWAFNSDGLGVAEDFKPTSRMDLLLVGDSLINKGNGLQRADELAPLLERRTGWRVWPAYAGSWSLQNELAFLRRNPHLVDGVDAIVLVVNSGDFGRPSEWRSELSHPTRRPALYLTYLFKAHVLKPSPAESSPFPVPERDLAADWVAFVRAAEKPVLAVAHSRRDEAGQACSWVPPALREAGAWTCHDGFAELGPAGFRDDVHPTPRGQGAIADAIAVNLPELTR